ncbi:MAG: hypothetical protein U0Y10_02195 [Spirosomataceae bacterium]
MSKQRMFYTMTCFCIAFFAIAMPTGPIIFDPADYTQNASKQSAFLSAVGETPDACIDFESSSLRNSPVGPAYKNLQNVSISAGGLTAKFAETDGNIWVAQGKGQTWEDVNNDGQNDLGEAPAYDGSWSLACSEQEDLTIDFSSNPVDYFSCYIGDWDVAGKTETTMDCTIILTFDDNSTQTIATDRTASSKYEFWGYYNGGVGKRVKKVLLRCYSNNSEWALDDVCFGTKTTTCTTPNIQVSAQSPYCTGDQIKLVADGGVDYKWSGPSSFSSTLQSPVRNFVTTSMAGVYSVSATGTSTCTASATVSVNITTCTTPSCPIAAKYCFDNCQVGVLDGTGIPPCTIGSCGIPSNIHTLSGTMNSCGSSTSSVGGNMCWGPLTDASFTNNNAKALHWSIEYPAGSHGTLEAFAFRHSQDINCPGSTDLVNSPQKIGIRVLKNGVEIYRNTNISTSTSWRTTIINLNSVFSGATTFDFELLPYEPANNGGTCSIYQIDELCVYACCTQCTLVASASVNTVCAGGTITLGATPTGAIGTPSYSWAGPGGFTSTAQNPTRSNAATTMAGKYTVTITDGNGCTATATVSVVINPSPTATAASSSPVCLGGSLNLTATGGGTYSWSGPGASVRPVANPVVVV